MNFKNSILILAATCLLCSSAFAKPAISIVGVADYAKPKYTDFSETVTSTAGTTSVSGKTAIRGGLLAEFPLSPRLGLEIGALYVAKKYEGSLEFGAPISMKSGGTTKYNSIQLPVLLNWHMGRFFTLGVGGYVAQGIGDATSIDSDGTETKESFEDAMLKKTDFGAIGSIGLALPLSSTISFVVDARYVMGLADIYEKGKTTMDGSIKNVDYQGLVGFRFGGK